MIRNIHISNYALIDAIDLELGEGLNIITGETGAGKSIMLGALGVLLGERADSRAVRDTSRKSVIEAEFSADCASLEGIFRENDLDWDPERIILRREIAPNGGRSRAFVNDSPVTLEQLRTVALQLVDIHSQNQNQLLASAEFQLSVVDELAGNAPLLAEMSAAYDNLLAARRALKESREAIEKTRADAEFLAFQLGQLDEFNPQEGEQEQLEHERDLLANMESVKEYLHTASQSLSEGPNNALAQIHHALDSLTGLADTLEDADALAQRLDSAMIEIRDIAETVTDYDSSLAADPRRLQEVEDRLSNLYALQRKHHVDTDAELIAIRQNLRSRLSEVENSEDTLADLESAVKAAKSEAVRIARQLSERRHALADDLAKQLVEKARPLGMDNLQCAIEVATTPLRRTGADEVRFMVAFNKNQSLMPVGGRASGGEVSRLMLALKSIIAEHMELPSIIFDEIDTGVSGDIAARMGRMMAALSSHIQVIAITHLPTIAALGHRHFKVYKEDTADSTLTRLRLLDREQRRAELALMLSGRPDDPSALATADTLLKG